MRITTDLERARDGDALPDHPCPGYNEDTDEECPGDGITQYLRPEEGQHWGACTACAYIFALGPEADAAQGAP